MFSVFLQILEIQLRGTNTSLRYGITIHLSTCNEQEKRISESLQIEEL